MSDSPAYTPGPWTVETEEKPPPGLPQTYIGSRSVPYVASVHGGMEPEELDANARLIAAAPELFEALEALAGLRDPFVSHEEVVAFARRAIDKVWGSDAVK